MIDGSSIGDLFGQYDRALEELSTATEAERAASQKVREMRDRVSNLQKAIDNVLETRREFPPRNTHWANADERKQRRETC